VRRRMTRRGPLRSVSLCTGGKRARGSRSARRSRLDRLRRMAGSGRRGRSDRLENVSRYTGRVNLFVVVARRAASLLLQPAGQEADPPTSASREPPRSARPRIPAPTARSLPVFSARSTNSAVMSRQPFRPCFTLPTNLRPVALPRWERSYRIKCAKSLQAILPST
jgi:hypothetical protein